MVERFRPASFYVYVLFRPWNGQPCYVGKGKRNRWLEHEWAGVNHQNKYLANIFKKAKRLGLTVTKEKRYTGLTEAQAFRHEIELIKLIGRSPAGPLVNMTDGGEGLAGLTFTPERRAKMSAAHKGRTRPPEIGAKISAAKRGKPGRKQSPETRAKISAFQKTRIRSPDIGAKVSATKKGRRLVGEQLVKHMAWLRSPEHRARQSEISRINWAKRKAGG